MPTSSTTTSNFVTGNLNVVSTNGNWATITAAFATLATPVVLTGSSGFTPFVPPLALAPIPNVTATFLRVEDLVEATQDSGEFSLMSGAMKTAAVQLSKKLVYRSANLDFDEHLDMAQMAMFIAQSTDDAREGPRAFMEKREPQFKGF